LLIFSPVGAGVLAIHGVHTPWGLMYLDAFSDSEQSANAEAGVQHCKTQGLPLVWALLFVGTPP
jgi:hypothetical protein